MQYKMLSDGFAVEEAGQRNLFMAQIYENLSFF